MEKTFRKLCRVFLKARNTCHIQAQHPYHTEIFSSRNIGTMYEEVVKITTYLWGCEEQLMTCGSFEHLSYWSELTKTGWLIGSRNPFLTALEAGSLRSVFLAGSNSAKCLFWGRDCKVPVELTSRILSIKTLVAVRAKKPSYFSNLSKALPANNYEG